MPNSSVFRCFMALSKTQYVKRRRKKGGLQKPQQHGLFWPFRRRLVKQTDAVLKHALSTLTKTVQGIFDDVLLFFSYTFTYIALQEDINLVSRKYRYVLSITYYSGGIKYLESNLATRVLSGSCRHVILSRFYLDFIQILSRFYLNFIWIRLG